MMRRVMVYDHRGEKVGKGTVVKLKDGPVDRYVRDGQLAGYIRVKMDNGLVVYVKEDLCKRLVKRR